MFRKAPLAGNASACKNCWCWICDLPFAQCSQWTSQTDGLASHCNAYDSHKAEVETRWRWHERAAAEAGPPALTPKHPLPVYQVTLLHATGTTLLLLHCCTVCIY